jgi:hypothetical protein
MVVGAYPLPREKTGYRAAFSVSGDELNVAYMPAIDAERFSVETLPVGSGYSNNRKRGSCGGNLLNRLTSAAQNFETKLRAGAPSVIRQFLNF